MAKSDQYVSQLESINKQLAGMTPANPTDAMADLNARVNNFAPQYAELRGMDQQAMAAPATLFNNFQKQYGATGGPSAMDRLQYMTNELGRIYGTRGAFSDALQNAQGGLNNILQGALQAYDSQRQGLQQQYSNLLPLYQTEMQKEMQRRALAAQAALANMGMQQQAGQFAQQQAAQQRAMQQQAIAGFKGDIRSNMQDVGRWQNFTDLGNAFHNALQTIGAPSSPYNLALSQIPIVGNAFSGLNVPAMINQWGQNHQF